MIYRGCIVESGLREVILGDARPPHRAPAADNAAQPPPCYVYFNHGSIQALSTGEPEMLAVGPNHYVACAVSAAQTKEESS